MDNGDLYKDITEFKSMQLYAEIKADMAATMADLKMIKRKQSEGMKEELLNSQQVMKILKITKGTLQSYRNKGVLPFKRNRGKIYYKVSDMEALLKSNDKKCPRKVKKHQGTYY
jgi:hypothetical protein